MTKPFRLADLPDPRELTPDLRKIYEDEVRFGAELKSLRVRLTDLASSRSSRGPRPPSDPQDVRVAVMLGDADVPSPRSGTDIEIDNVRQRISDIERAIAILASRRRAAIDAAGVPIVAAIQPEYRRRVRALGEALIAAHGAHLAMYEVTDALGDRGISWGGQLGVHFADQILGSPRDSYGQLAYWLYEVADAGIIDKGEIPAELRR